MKQNNSIVLFQEQQVRRIEHQGEWYFVVTDVIQVLTDSTNPTDYLKKLRKRDPELNKGWGQIVTPLLCACGGQVMPAEVLKKPTMSKSFQPIIF